MSQRFDAIIFDMDGTLVDSEVVWEVAEAEMFAARNITYTDDVRQQVIGLRLDEFFHRLKAIYSLNEPVETLMDELIDRMLPLIPQRVVPKPGAPEIIAYAAQAGMPYCIASSSPQSIIDAIVEAQGWASLFPRRYSANLVTNGKPAPDIYLYAAEQLNAAPDRCLAVEDSPTGAKSAIAAGMTVCVVPDSHSSPDRFDGMQAQIYDDLHGVLAMLKNRTDTQT